MSVSTVIRRCAPVVFIALLLSAASARDASAQIFVSPFIGYNFSGDAGCQDILNCEDKKINWGGSFGAVGSIVGGELEFGYTDNFFGESSGQQSNVLTIMGNFMLAPKFGAVQPYGVIGLGVIRTSVETTGVGVDTNTDESQIGWDGGGGVMVFFGDHVGVRGEVRYYRSFQVIDFSEFPNLPTFQEPETKLDFGRIAAGLVLKF